MGVYYICVNLKFNVMTKMKYHFLFILFFVIGLMACKKEIDKNEQPEINEKNILTLQDWYEKQLSGSNITESNLNIFKLTHKPDWSNTYSFQSGKTIITPLNNEELKNTFSFFFTKMGSNGEVVFSKLMILLMPKNHLFNSIEKQYLIKILELDKIPDFFSGTILIYDFIKKDISRKVIENGSIKNLSPENIKIINSKVNDIAILNANSFIKNNSVSNLDGEGGWIYTYFIVYDTQTGVIYSATFLFATWVGGNGGGTSNSPQSDPPPNSGNTGASDPCAEASQTAIDNFNSYTSMLPGQSSFTCPYNNNSYNTGTETWVGVNGGGGWKIKAIASYGYYRYDFITTDNQHISTFKFDLFSSGNGFYTGTNNIVTSTYTTTQPTLNQVFNNDSETAYGRSQIFGSIRHVSNVHIPLPLCGDVQLDITLDVNPSIIILPK